MVRYPPPLVLSFTQAHLCDTPFCNDYRAIIVQYLTKTITKDFSANTGLPLPLGRGVCETKSKNGRSRPRKPFISRVFCAQRGIPRPWSQTMVSEGARPWGRGRSGDCEPKQARKTFAILSLQVPQGPLNGVGFKRGGGGSRSGLVTCPSFLFWSFPRPSEPPTKDRVWAK